MRENLHQNSSNLASCVEAKSIPLTPHVAFIRHIGFLFLIYVVKFNAVKLDTLITKILNSNINILRFPKSKERERYASTSNGDSSIVHVCWVESESTE